MTTCSSDIRSFKRVTITKVKFNQYVVNIDGQPIEASEVRARLSLFMQNGDSDPLNIELVKVLLLHQQIFKKDNFNWWLVQLGLVQNPTGEPQDLNGQYLCVYLSDFLELSNIDIAILLDWITSSGQNYDRMIKHRKKAFYDNLSQKYASILERIASQSSSEPIVEVSEHVKHLIQKELYTDIMIGIEVVQSLIDAYTKQLLHTDERAAKKVKNSRKKEKPDMVSNFICDVLHQIEKSLM